MGNAAKSVHAKIAKLVDTRVADKPGINDY